MEHVWAGLVGTAGIWLLVFLTFEVYALITGRQTLSAWIREKLGIYPVQPKHVWAAPLFAAILLAFTVWFVPHIEGWVNW